MTNSNLTTRLKSCFSVVFPKLRDPELFQASVSSVPDWDSMATVTLAGLIEEEFAVSVEVDDLIEFESFEQVHALINKKTHH